LTGSRLIFIAIVLKKGGNAVDAAIASTLGNGFIHIFANGKKKKKKKKELWKGLS
jgi:hypothetical protein